LKLKEAVDLEVKERTDVDDVINFFADIKNGNNIDKIKTEEMPQGMSLADIIYRHKMRKALSEQPRVVPPIEEVKK